MSSFIKSPETSGLPEDNPQKFIGTGIEIGRGTYKIVYSCDITNKNKAIFKLPKGTDETKLCIVVVDIIKLIQRKYDNDELFNEYIIQTAEEKSSNENKEIFENEINKETKLIIDEFKFQTELKQLVPQIYDYKNDKTTKVIYVLEEKCGMSLVEYIKSHSDQQTEGLIKKNIDGTYNYDGMILPNLRYTDENVFLKIVNLVNEIADYGYMNIDIKPENTCTIIDENGLLTNIIALDVDPQFFININLSNKKHREILVENAKIFMLTLFLAYLGKRSNITFVNDIVVEHLDRAKIKNMLTFFVNNRIVCLRSRHPLLMLYHYIIGLDDKTQTSCSDNRSPKKIEKITDEICKCIFIEEPIKKNKKKGGSFRTMSYKRISRNNKNKSSKKSRK